MLEQAPEKNEQVAQDNTRQLNAPKNLDPIYPEPLNPKPLKPAKDLKPNPFEPQRQGLHGESNESNERRGVDAWRIMGLSNLKCSLRGSGKGSRVPYRLPETGGHGT